VLSYLRRQVAGETWLATILRKSGVKFSSAYLRPCRGQGEGRLPGFCANIASVIVANAMLNPQQYLTQFVSAEVWQTRLSITNHLRWLPLPSFCQLLVGWRWRMIAGPEQPRGRLPKRKGIDMEIVQPDPRPCKNIQPALAIMLGPVVQVPALSCRQGSLAAHESARPPMVNVGESPSATWPVSEKVNPSEWALSAWFQAQGRSYFAESR